MADTIAGRTVLVTGATGFVGRHLTRHFVAAGAHVFALVRDPASPRLVEGVEAIAVPERARDMVDAVVAIRPEVCVHLATHFVAEHSVDDLDGMLDANVALGARLAEALVAVGPVPLVDTGSVWQHAGGAAFSPANVYAATKQSLADILTAYALRHDLPVARLTLTDTYGPDDPRRKLVPALVAAARSGEPMQMSSGGQLIDLVHVADVVRAFEMVMIDQLRAPSALGGPQTRDMRRYVVTSGSPTTVRDVVEVFQQATGYRLAVQWGARPDRAVDLDPRSPDGPVPGWRPAIDLRTGFGRLLVDPGDA